MQKPHKQEIIRYVSRAAAVYVPRSTHPQQGISNAYNYNTMWNYYCMFIPANERKYDPVQHTGTWTPGIQTMGANDRHHQGCQSWNWPFMTWLYLPLSSVRMTEGLNWKRWVLHPCPWGCPKKMMHIGGIASFVWFSLCFVRCLLSASACGSAIS